MILYIENSYGIVPYGKKTKIKFLFLFFNIFLINYTILINSSLAQNNNWKTTDFVICTAPREQWEKMMCNDGSGGTFIVWKDRRLSDFDIYLQRINSAGVPLWDEDGLIICNRSRDQTSPQIFSDGEGGVYITWYDYIIGPDYGPIYIQKVNANGEIIWNHDGIAISDERIFTIQPIICNDGDGGAIIVWRQGASGIYNLYAQRINSDGYAQWNENGTRITDNSIGYTADQRIISDTDGGAIIVWEDDRTGRSKIYAQRIDPNGNLLWNNNGLLICHAIKDQYNPQICNDGKGGVIITWIDTRDDLIDDIDLEGDIYAQSVDPDGNLLWGENGTAICIEPHEQNSPQIVSDMAGGALIFWEDNRTGTNWDLYTQKIDSNGFVKWSYNGILICNAENNGDLYSQLYNRACSNDGGGAFIAWRDYRNGNDWDIYAQLLSSNGIMQWEINGKSICNASNDQIAVSVCSDNIGNLFITWSDKRIDAFGDIYGAKIYLESKENLISGYNYLIIIGFLFFISVIFLRRKEQSKN